MTDPGCFFHGVEPVPDEYFRICLECGHCWPTEAHFAADAAWLGDKPLADLSFCPLCTHDF